MQTINFNSIQDFNDYGVYALFLKENKSCRLAYGRFFKSSTGKTPAQWRVA